MPTAAEGEGGWELKVGCLNSAKVEFAELGYAFPTSLVICCFSTGRQEGRKELEVALAN